MKHKIILSATQFSFLCLLLIKDRLHISKSLCFLQRNLIYQNFIFDVFGQEIEQLSDIFIFLSTDFKKLNSKFLSHLFSFFITNFSIFSISLISNKNFDYILTGLCFDLLKPVSQRLKRTKIIDRIGHDDPHSTFIVSLSNRLETLLTCCIPYLKTDSFALDFNCTDFEVNTYMR